VGVYSDKFYEWENNRPTYGDKIPNSVDLPVRTIEAMSFYAVKTNRKPVSKRYTDDVLLYQLSPMQSIDIDNREDLELAENICAGQRSKKIQQLNVLSKIITSSLLSDICKEHNIPHFLSKDIKSLSGGNFLGYAKTLKIKALEEHQKDPNKKDWEGIFDALKSYEFIVPGDVIIVSTDVPDKAYFGDLNATFAVRQGAVGVVVDGFTRDIDRVSKMNLPVFARGNKADDVRYEGTLETMNMPVIINDVTIRNNDIIFADTDGVICIPQEKWNFVLTEVKSNLKKEMMVKLEATFGADPFDVLNNVGLF
jgi:regulator of RNase E activity RraA